MTDKQTSAAAEKAAEEWARSYAYMMPNTNPCKERVLAAQEEGFLAGAAWAAPKWISAKERLPGDDQDVLVWSSVAGEVQMAYMTKGTLTSIHDHLCTAQLGITHWMPLPDAPKEEK